MPVTIRVLSASPGPRIIRGDDEPMWINKEERVAFVAHPRTGSTETGMEILSKRGFTRWLGHHGVPWGGDHPRNATMGQAGELWWWFNEPLLDWTFYAGHRNHFEVFHSIGRGVLGGHPPTPKRFTDYLWKHPGLYHNQHILFPAFFEVAGCREIRFAHLRDDVDAMLRRHNLNPLREDEGHRDRATHWTRAKPRGEHYSEYLTTDCREWIEEMYGTEMRKMGYGWNEKPQSE